jgi:hypothetical protein
MVERNPAGAGTCNLITWAHITVYGTIGGSEGHKPREELTSKEALFFFPTIGCR